MNPDQASTPPESEADPGFEPRHEEPHPARELSVHVLRMLETRMEAAGIAIQGETHRFMARLQLRMLVGAGIFFAIWGGIVLLAIALPEDLRVPVLGAVVGGFVLLAVVAHFMARKNASSQQVGSMRWFLDSLRQDLELLSRSLSRPQQTRSSPDRSPPHDLAA